ncbi:MAG: hypothetical protein ACOCUO_03600 [archaeon]
MAVAVWISILVGSSMGMPLGAAGQARAQEMVTLTITVEDRYSDAPGNVELHASWDGRNTTETTRSNGQALLDVPKGANVSINVESGEYVRNVPYNMTDARETSRTIDVSRRGSVELEVVRNGSPLGNTNVTFSQDGRTIAAGVTESDDHFSPYKPIPNATVSIDGIGTARTLSNGEATLRLPVNTDQPVTISKDGYETGENTIRVNESAMESNLSVNRAPALDLRAANDRVVVGETVQVTLVDEYGDAMRNATVQLDGSAVGKTDDTGTATVRIESDGDRSISATKGGV